jgi:ABC-type uncharacterized transport system auxiliary subunit
MKRIVRFVACLPLLAGCLLRNTSDPPRFFRPVSTMLDVPAADVAPSVQPGTLPVRLRPVQATPFLRERVVWRRSEGEYGLYEERRWTEPPARYVERALTSALEATPGISLTSDRRAESLSIELLAFDEVLYPRHEANIVVAASLNDADGPLLLQRTFSATEAIADDHPGSMPHAMGSALDELARQVAGAVAASASQRPRGPRSGSTG